MTADEYLAALHRLRLSRAAAGRYMGVSARTSRRYANGEAAVPPAIALLLRAMIELKAVPVVPPWSRAWEAQQ